jgi:hypothetical protein
VHWREPTRRWVGGSQLPFCQAVRDAKGISLDTFLSFGPQLRDFTPSISAHCLSVQPCRIYTVQQDTYRITTQTHISAFTSSHISLWPVLLLQASGDAESPLVAFPSSRLLTLTLL